MSTSRERPDQRRVALAVTLAGGLVFVALAAWLVPWHPVPGGTPAPADAASVFTPAEIQRGEDYARWARVWSWSSLAVSLMVACVLGLGPWGARLVGRLRGWWWVRVVLAVAALAVIGRVVTLPFAVLLRQRALDHGLSNQAWSGFAADLVKNGLVTIVATSIVLVVLVACARRWTTTCPGSKRDRG